MPAKCWHSNNRNRETAPQPTSNTLLQSRRGLYISKKVSNGAKPIPLRRSLESNRLVLIIILSRWRFVPIGKVRERKQPASRIPVKYPKYPNGMDKMEPNRFDAQELMLVKLVCPVCKREIVPEGSNWKCPGCSAPFSYNGGILSFLTPEERYNEGVYEEKQIANWSKTANVRN